MIRTICSPSFCLSRLLRRSNHRLLFPPNIHTQTAPSASFPSSSLRPPTLSSSASPCSSLNPSWTGRRWISIGGGNDPSALNPKPVTRRQKSIVDGGSDPALESEVRSAAIVGAGSVGSTIAIFLLQAGIYDEVYMIDTNQERVEGEVMDLSDASFVSDTRIRVGTYEDARRSSIVIITAGAKQRPNETREQLLQRNVHVLHSIAEELLPVSDSTIVLLVANPVDILTMLFQQISQIPKHRVIGSGTYLDSMRLRMALSQKFNIAPSAVNVSVVGMHGDLQIPVWSGAQVGGVPIQYFGRMSLEEMTELADSTRTKAYRIISAKGSTYYGIAACVAHLSQGITQDKHQIFQLSIWSDEFESYLSWPAIIGSKGIVKPMPLSLTDEERRMVSKATRQIKSSVQESLSGFSGHMNI